VFVAKNWCEIRLGVKG